MSKFEESVWFCILEPQPSPKRKRLKQLMREHGNLWKAMSQPTPMQCFNWELGVDIESLDGTHRRNVLFDDINRWGLAEDFDNLNN